MKPPSSLPEASVPADAHPHDLESGVPERLPAAEVRALSEIAPWRAARAIAEEWAGIALAIGAAHLIGWAALLPAVLFIGARQHALMVIAHDASHYRLLPDRRWNDWVGNLFLAWPMFVSVEGFRHFHGPHHRFLNGEGDGNRQLWGTHDAAGEVAAEWRYPKPAAEVAARLLWRGSGLTGLRWLLRGVIGGTLAPLAPLKVRLARLVFMVVVAAALTAAGAWQGFLLYWVLPYCTWQVLIQYVRLICEHSAISGEGPWSQTRTTVPTALEALLVLPRQVGYHLEHHWYPSVPFYRLPELHARLMARPGFAASACVSRSVWASLRSVCGRGGL